MRTLIKPDPIHQSATDKCYGFLLLSGRKEVIVLTKRLLEICPSLPAPPAAAVADSDKCVVIDRLLYQSTVAALRHESWASDVDAGTAVLTTMVELGRCWLECRPCAPLVCRHCSLSLYGHRTVLLTERGCA